MTRLLPIIVFALILSGCSTGKLSLYKEGDLFKRNFREFLPHQNAISGEYYEVRRNSKKQVTSAKHFSGDKHLIEKSYYTYARNGNLTRQQYTEYFHKGLPRISKEWIYEDGRIVQQEEQWYSRARSMEKKLTIFYDKHQQPYLEQTWGLGDKFESSTEYYYDYKHRLDKSRRNFFGLEGELIDFWLTVYTNENQISTEEHYLPNNSMITFYRYTYHPVKDYREQEEILDVDRNIFVVRKFDIYGLLQSEEEMDGEMVLKSRKVYEYSDKNKPQSIRYYDSSNTLFKTSKYKKPIYLHQFRTPVI